MKTGNDSIVIRIGQKDKQMLEVIVSILNETASDHIKEKLCNENRNSINITSLIQNGLSIKQLHNCVEMTTALSWDFGTEIIKLFSQIGINEDSKKTRQYATSIRNQYLKERMTANTRHTIQGTTSNAIL